MHSDVHSKQQLEPPVPLMELLCLLLQPLEQRALRPGVEEQTWSGALSEQKAPPVPLPLYFCHIPLPVLFSYVNQLLCLPITKNKHVRLPSQTTAETFFMIFMQLLFIILLFSYVFNR